MAGKGYAALASGGYVVMYLPSQAVYESAAAAHDESSIPVVGQQQPQARADRPAAVAGQVPAGDELVAGLEAGGKANFAPGSRSVNSASVLAETIRRPFSSPRFATIAANRARSPAVEKRPALPATPSNDCAMGSNGLPR